MTEGIRPTLQPGERETNARYSLAYDRIGSEDIMLLRHPSGGAVRVIAYESADEQRSQLRDRLVAKGLILGMIIGDAEDTKQHFKVPKSARPIAYDANVEASGAFSYNDEQMFFDLGQLLAELYQASDVKLVLSGDVGRSVAFVEFTHHDERQLYLVPGVERVMESLETDVSPIGFYTERLTEAFGHRFDNAAISFRMGFSEAIREGEEL